MPITEGFTTRGMALKGKGHIHTDKWHRCIEHVKANSPGYEPHAVCTHAIGYKESINPEHQTPGPHASANTRRFKESAKRRREAKKMDYAAVMKLDDEKFRVLKEHKCWGHACGGGGAKQALPHGKVSEAHAKELGLEPGKYRNVRGVGVMGASHADIKGGKAKSASVTADTASSTLARDKKKNASHIEHNQAAKSHSEAAAEHEKLGNTKDAARHKEKAQYHREQSKRIKG